MRIFILIKNWVIEHQKEITYIAKKNEVMNQLYHLEQYK